ncbi:MAG TPA: type III-A CRISPR-associated protein Csm2 [Gammaproteobacteria bacterium]|nr:type III-A CRISPR-associated protein Csm2 [Gammaproteobacteria bacterium]
MSYPNQKRHGGKPRQDRRRLGVTIRFTNEEGKIDADLFDKTANRVAKIVANKNDRRASQINKSTQLRRFYDELVMWEEKVRQDEKKFDDYLPFIRMLKAKAAYAEGRKLVDGAFVDLIEQAIDFIKSATDLRTAKLFFEAFMGFYKLEKGD